MTLPKRPERSSPIPNQPFDSPEVATIKGPYWDMPIGTGLEADGQGSVQTSGSEPSEPSAYLYGSNGFVGVGAGLQLGANGELEQGGYIYCTPQYSNLPVSYPPYGCQTEVNTTGVTDFTEAWYNCEEITDFPCIDSSTVVNFNSSWSYCSSLTNFPSINTILGENFYYSWAYTGLTSFPSLNFGSALSFEGTWASCYYLESFPPVNSGSVLNFYGSWVACYSLQSFPKIDSRSGVNFGYSWFQCNSLLSFPDINCSSGEIFNGSWHGCSSLTSFPNLTFNSGIEFRSAWRSCTNLMSFPPGMFDSCLATDFSLAWQNCALSRQSVDNILVSLNTAGQSNGIVNIDGGTSSPPGAAGLAAKASLEGRGWTVTTN